MALHCYVFFNNAKSIEGSMKKLIILMLFILLFGYCYADNNYYIIHFYKPYGRSPTDTLEYLFYDDGLIKQITYYDLREECDYYNWEKIKKNLKILRQYKINRSDKVINSVLIENNSETIEKRIEKKDDGTSGENNLRFCII